MSAVQQRERRSTAGKRMTFLTGQAAEQDDAFWGHDTWGDDPDDQGNESFHSSDEDSALQRDEFDSDFDESESDHEEDEQARGAQEEQALQKAEQQQSSNKRKGYVEKGSVAKRGRWGTGRGKRIMGDGLNAGIVLNIPRPGEVPLKVAALPPIHAATVDPGICAAVSQAMATVPSVSTVPIVPPVVPKKPAAKRKATGPTLASTRKRRNASAASGYSSHDRQTEVTAQLATAAQSSTTRSASPKQQTQTKTKKTKQRFSQEELLLEAVNTTEAENQRWLLGRKRHQAEKEQASTPRSESLSGTVIEKFVSRRGYLNTITFGSMDHLPPILSGAMNRPCKKPPVLVCAVTGKPARYKDPKTGKGYLDAAAFRELRRRLEANEVVDTYSAVVEASVPQPARIPVNGMTTLTPPSDVVSSTQALPTPSNGTSSLSSNIGSVHQSATMAKCETTKSPVTVPRQQQATASVDISSGKSTIPSKKSPATKSPATSKLGIRTSPKRASAKKKSAKPKAVPASSSTTTVVKETVNANEASTPDTSVAADARVKAVSPPATPTKLSAAPSSTNADAAAAVRLSTAVASPVSGERRSPRRRTPTVKARESTATVPPFPSPPKSGEKPAASESVLSIAPSLGEK